MTAKAPKQTPKELSARRAEFISVAEDVLARLKDAKTHEEQANLWYDLYNLVTAAQRLAYQLQAVGRNNDPPANSVK